MKVKFYSLILILLSGIFQLNADIKIIHGPYLQNVGEHEATVVWVSDQPSVGWLEMAPDDGTHFYAEDRNKIFDTKIGIKKTSRVHSVKITGLKPGTNYRYRVCSQEVLSHKGHKIQYGNIVTDFDYTKGAKTFKTNDTSKNEISFAMVNDIHGRNDVLENMVKQCDLKKTDLFLFNGDMVSVMNNEEQMFEGFMDKATELFASSIPMYYCRGNHETRGAMAPYFQDYFNTEEEELFYIFRQGPACFVILDCGEDKPDTDIEYYGITAYDEYRTKQAEWLKEVLESDLYKNAKYKIIVCHMPPFKSWHGMIDIYNKFVPLLNEAKPDVYLCGHLHRYVRQDAGKDGISFPIIVNSNNTLLKANISDNEMDICIFDLEGKQIDRLQIKK